jgi:general nucleoside transport system ATP-binding protein
VGSPSDAIVEFRGVSKRFGPVVANDHLDLRIRRGTIHGIVGENGAGKSTAMKLLFGLYRPDAGEILLEGRPCAWHRPADAIARGIGMVHQHFMLAGPYSALDNILLGAEPLRAGLLDRRTARARLDKLAAQYGLPVDWQAPVEQLPVGIQQRIEILKLLFREASVLILDEPTAVLTPQETSALFVNLRWLRDQGKTILLVTHKLKEVLALTERVTVLRAGKVSGELQTARTNAQELADLMVGRKVDLQVHATPARPRPEAALEVRRLTLLAPTARHRGASGRRRLLSDVSFSVQRGELVGIAGVEGNGQSDLLRMLLEPRQGRRRLSGSIGILGHDATTLSAERIHGLGVAVIPEDRLDQGLLPAWPVRDNFLLGLHHRPQFNWLGLLRTARLRECARRALQQYDVRPRDLGLPAGNLSGGNQQKLVIAREFEREPALLLAAQPTRGVDVGAIEFIHRRILRARDAGAGVLLVSSELDEILALSDRILVMFEGRIVAEYGRGEVSEGELGLKMGGG